MNASFDSTFRCGALRCLRFATLLLFGCLLPLPIRAEEQGATATSGSATEVLWHESSVLIFRAGMTIDADGSPRAYAPLEGQALDALSNAGTPGDWNGIVSLNGVALVQGSDDPQPGFYVSQTSLEDKQRQPRSQASFVDSEEVPYIAFPPTVRGPELGDVAIVLNTRNLRASAAIFADESPRLGEGSIALAKALGVDPDPRAGGTGDGIIYLVFERSGDGTPLPLQEIWRRARDLWSTADPACEYVSEQHPEWLLALVPFQPAEECGLASEEPAPK